MGPIMFQVHEIRYHRHLLGVASLISLDGEMGFFHMTYHVPCDELWVGGGDTVCDAV